MKRKILILIAGLLLISLNAFADDVSIDSSGNVRTGVSNTNAELEVAGGSGEGGILGTTSGTGASGVYGINTSYGDYGILGYYGTGVYGYSSGWAGYFQGNARVTGNLTLDGSLIGPGIGDITGVTAGTGLSGGGTSGTVTLNVNTTAIQSRVSGTCAAGSSIRTVNADGTVVCETDDTGIAAETDPQVGTITTGYLPKWDGSALVTGAIFDNGNVGIGTTAPGSRLHIAGGGWDLTNSEGDFKIGTDTIRLKIGIATSGGGAGDVRIRSHGGTNRLMFGGGTNDVLTITDTNVGIGTVTPNEQLEITGNLRLPATTATTGIIRSGADTLIHTYGQNNFFAGINAGNLTMTGGNNTAIGKEALYFNTTGWQNTAIGHSALISNTTGFFNTAIGDAALQYNNGSYNTGIGSYADVYDNVTNATAIGNGAVADASNRVRIGNYSVTQIGGQVAWSNLSDMRGKKDIRDIGYGLEFIRSLRPVEFRLKNGNDRLDFGFIAQDIETLLGTEYNILGIGSDAERRLSLRYTDFIAPMVKAMQEQQKQIESQQTQIDELKKIVEELVKR